MHFLVLFLIITSFTILGPLYFNKKYEEFLPVSLFFIIVSLYMFYIFNFLKIGLLLIYILSLIPYIILLSKIFKKRKIDIFKKIVTPGMFIFIFAYIIIYFITKDRIVYLWDELRLWAAYPKILFYNDSIQIGKSAILYEGMQTYTPGMPLFLYFITKTLGVFKENYLFFGYALFGLSILLPTTKNITWKKWWLILPTSIFLILFPMLFANSNFDYLIYYKTLFIDPLIGLLFGYSMYFCILKYEPSKFYYLNFILSLFTLFLLKESGILFIILIILSYFIVHLNLSNKVIIKNKSGKIKKMLLCVIIVLVLCFSFNIVKSYYGISNEHLNSINLSKIVKLLISPTIRQKQILYSFFDNIIRTSLVDNGKIILSFLPLFILFLLFTILIIFLSKKENRKVVIVSSVTMIFSSIIFLFSLCFLYVFSLDGVYSYPRYICTIFSALSIYMLYMLTDKKLYNISERGNRIILLIYLLILFTICPVSSKEVMYKEYFLQVRNYSEEMKKTILKSNIPPNNNILLINNDSILYTVIYHHQLQFLLIDNNIYLPYDAIYSTSENTCTDLIKNIYKNNIDYVINISKISSSNGTLSCVGIDRLEYVKIYYVNNENDNIILKIK